MKDLLSLGQNMKHARCSLLEHDGTLALSCVFNASIEQMVDKC